ncbi:hypothetical protein OEZ86_005428 [Tetradesmus obliquus]|nr:hypothetical protein OEZ86_005428 [Tetradesmus obliquus]
MINIEFGMLPTKRPTLHSHCYDLVLQALLVDPAHHGLLLSLVSAWPASCFHPTALIDAIAQRMQRPGGDSRELWQALAVLYRGQGRPDLSLAVYLQLQLPSVFDFIQEHSLLSYLDEKAYLLMAIDEGKALELLGAHLDTLPPAAVVPGLLDAMAVAEGDGDAERHETWRRRLFNYLDKVFTVEPSAAGEYAELCVHLYADFCPARLMDFLQGSQSYPLEAALEVAEQRGMVDEQVYILSRMGNSRAALALIIERLQDIPRAIEFVRLQRDEELVEELIDWALRSADTTGQLLDHIGGNINPLRVIQKIPEGMSINSLRDRLRHIIADFRTQTSLREGCNAILRSDCLKLVNKLQAEVKRAMPVVWLQREQPAAAGVHLHCLGEALVCQLQQSILPTSQCVSGLAAHIQQLSHHCCWRAM